MRKKEEMLSSLAQSHEEEVNVLKRKHEEVLEAVKEKCREVNVEDVKAHLIKRTLSSPHPNSNVISPFQAIIPNILCSLAMS